MISCQTAKSWPKINVWKKYQISDRKIKSCWNDLIWNLLLDLTWFIFTVFDVKSFWPLIFMWQRKRALKSLWWSKFTMIARPKFRNVLWKCFEFENKSEETYYFRFFTPFHSSAFSIMALKPLRSSYCCYVFFSDYFLCWPKVDKKFDLGFCKHQDTFSMANSSSNSHFHKGVARYHKMG